MLFRPWKRGHTVVRSYCQTLFIVECVSNVYTQIFDHLEGHVGDVNQLVVGEGQHVEEAELCESSRLDLLYTVMLQVQLLQRGEAIEGLLQQSGQKKEV